MKKKFKRADLIRSIITSTCLLGASTGIIFGVSAGNFSIDYIDLNNAYTRLDAALNPATNYSSQNIQSKWNFDPIEYPGSVALEPHSPEFSSNDTEAKEQWLSLHPEDLDRAAMQFNRNDVRELMPSKYAWEKHRLEYCSMVLDGAAHSELDRSFNQSVLQGLADFCRNKKNAALDQDIRSLAFKPGQDTTQFFQDIYRTICQSRRVLALPGFVHVTPLESLGSRDESEDTGIVHYPGERNIDGTVFILIDGNIPNNQNVASVLFRSDQPAFLSAISTAMYFLNNLDTYHSNYQDLAVGVYGGTPIPTVVIYMGGFQRGIEFFNEFILKQILADLRACLDTKPDYTFDNYPYAKKIMESSKYKEELDNWANIEPTRRDELLDIEFGTGLLYDEFNIKLIKLGDFNTLFTGSFAAGDAIGITKQLLNRGASAILPVAGSQTVDSTQEVASQKSNCTILGVDSAMEDGDAQRALPFEDKTEAPDGSKSDHKGDSIKFSAVKDMTTVVNKICELSMNNKIWDASISDGSGGLKPDPEKAICNIGFQTCGNIRNGLISVSFDGFYFLMEGLKQIVHAKEVSDGGLVNIKFTELWIKEVEKYCTDSKHITEFDSEAERESFMRNAKSFGVPEDKEEGDTGILTFDKGTADKPTMIYKYYSQVMAILGETLNDIYLTFNKDMSLLLPPTPDYDDPEHPWQPALAGDAQDGTILEWLKYNMYFTC